MPARDEKEQIGKGKSIGEARGQRMRLQMIDRNEGHASPECNRFASGQAHDQPTDQAGTRGRGNRVDRIEAKLSLGKRLENRGIEHLDMGAGGDFRHHAAIDRVQVELRAHDIGQDRAAPVRRAAHHGRRGLVAARLDAEHRERGVFAVGNHLAFYSA